MNSIFYEKLQTLIPKEQIFCDEPMQKHTTFRIGGNADYYICPNEQQLASVLTLAKECQIPVTVIGNGSNLLVSDLGIRGLVIEIGRNMDFVNVEGTQITVGAGTLLAKVANCAQEAGLGGLEFAAGIPGSVGGAVVMNAGAYGGEIKDILKEVTILTKDGKQQVLQATSLELSYRHSLIPEKEYIITSAVFSLEPKEPTAIRERMQELRQQRIEKQPLEYPSAGSTFKRPEGHFAGKLIMDAGLAGYTIGGAQVSPKHCGFVINYQNATASDVKQLILDVQKIVKEQFQVDLEPEVKMIGE